jgi:hypothetical protein
MKPREFINFIQENSNNNGTLKSSFVIHYLGKFSDQELVGIKSSIQKAISAREKTIVDEKIAYLQSLGYKVSK